MWPMSPKYKFLTQIVVQKNITTELYHIAKFGDLKQKNWRFEIGELAGDFTKVTRMDGSPNDPIA